MKAEVYAHPSARAVGRTKGEPAGTVSNPLFDGQYDLQMENYYFAHAYALSLGLSHERACFEGAMAGFSLGHSDRKHWPETRARILAELAGAP